MLLTAESGSVLEFAANFCKSIVRLLTDELEPQRPPHQRPEASPFFRVMKISTEFSYSPEPVVESVSSK